MTGEEALRQAASVLVVDWPSRAVPETLARAGLEVVVKGGPQADRFSVYEVTGGDGAEPRPLGRRPEHVDLVYCFRPVGELAGIVATAQELGAAAVWVETGSDQARQIVEAGGLAYVDEPSIVEAALARRHLPPG